MEGLVRFISGLLSLYFVFDFVFWNGGLVDPSILYRIANATAFVGICQVI